MHINKILFLVVLFIAGNSFSQNILEPEEAFRLALENNYGIKITYNDVEIAENNAGLLNSGYLPSLTANAGTTYNRDNTEAEFSDGTVRILEGAKSNRLNAGVTLNYTLFDGLGRLYNYKRLKELYDLSELEARETIENTIYNLFTIYYNVAELSENVTSFEQALAISKDRITRSQYQFDYGQVTKLAVLNAQVDINNDSINLINSKQQLGNTKRDLNFVLGNVLEPNFKVDTLVNFILKGERDALLNKVKSSNVLLQQVEKNILINEFNIKATRGNFFPTIGLFGSYGYSKNNNNAASFLAVSTNSGLSGGLNLSWDIFDSGTTITRVNNAKINLESQELIKEELLISIERDFYNAWDDYINKLTIYQVQADNIITATANFERTEEKFKLGQVTSIEFRQAQLNLISAELSRNQAKYDAKLAELRILQLSGDLLNIDFASN
ncbi:Outer membrane protein TolC [Flavobacteriaceae bacterium MAR_2010_188]|nr:Outer membrane protein TolC [Flavobacteriaceae bacterium MAR_2010_188]